MKKASLHVLFVAVAAMGIAACSDVSDDERMLYFAHPEEIVIAHAQTVDYTESYKHTVRLKNDTLGQYLTKARYNLKDEADNPENELSIFWPDRFDDIPGVGRIGYMHYVQGSKEMDISVAPLGYVFPTDGYKQFYHFFDRSKPKTPDFDSIVALFPEQADTKIVIESGMDYHDYVNAITGQRDRDESITKALDAELAKYLSDYDAWVAEWNSAKEKYYRYIKEVKYAFLNNPSPKYYIWGNTYDWNTHPSMQAGDAPELGFSGSEMPAAHDPSTQLLGSHWMTPSYQALCWFFNFNGGPTPKFNGEVSIDGDNGIVIKQIKGTSNGQKVYQKAIRMAFKGYMQPNGSVKYDNKHLYVMGRDQARPTYQQILCYSVKEDFRPSISNDLPLENGYLIYPVRK